MSEGRGTHPPSGWGTHRQGGYSSDWSVLTSGGGTHPEGGCSPAGAGYPSAGGHTPEVYSQMGRVHTSSEGTRQQEGTHQQEGTQQQWRRSSPFGTKLTSRHGVIVSWAHTSKEVLTSRDGGYSEVGRVQQGGGGHQLVRSTHHHQSGRNSPTGGNSPAGRVHTRREGSHQKGGLTPEGRVLTSGDGTHQ